MIKAAIFDIDGVLLDSLEANTKFFQDLLVRAGYPCPAPEEYQSIFHLNMKAVIKHLTKSDSEEEINRIWEIGRNREIQIDHSLMRIPDGLGEVIEELSKNYLLGIATSRVREGIYESPPLAKLEKYFKIAVSAQDTENHKPHPEPLLFAARGMGVRPEECVYVGDAETDLMAAHAAGMKAIIYSKNNFNQADAQTSDFKELPKLISLLK